MNIVISRTPDNVGSNDLKNTIDSLKQLTGFAYSYATT